MLPQGASASKYDFFEEDHKFDYPVKLIKTVNDLKMWEKSEAYYEYIGFIQAVNMAVKGKSNSVGSQNASENVEKVMELLRKIDIIIDEVPPIQQPQRFGNKAFREFYTRLKNDALPLLQNTVPYVLFRSIPEIMMYLIEGFGNSTRIDYGTGHEISFVMFLICLCKMLFFEPDDYVPIGCKIFPKYLEIARKLQTTYRMEPAGSHGVWSLDDFQFVPFIWGSSQLAGHPKVEPSSFLDPEIVDLYADDYMFLSCIQYINSVKTGPFAEHSNQLWSISAVPSWSKINSGLIRMYKVEVLGKFPVVQHIIFGSLLTLKPANETELRSLQKKPVMAPPPPPPPPPPPQQPIKDDKTESKEYVAESESKEDNLSGGASKTNLES